MSGAHVSFGVRCKRCGRSFGAMVSLGSAPVCACGSTEFVADNQWSNISNFICPHCGCAVGHMIASGPATCPGCKSQIN
jgi:hypothetical protein